MDFWDDYDERCNLVQHANSKHAWKPITKRLLPQNEPMVPITFARALSARGVQTGLWGDKTFNGGWGEVPACCVELWQAYESGIVEVRFSTLVDLAVEIYKTELEHWVS